VTDGFTDCDKVKGWVEGELGRGVIDVAGDAKGTRNVQEREWSQGDVQLRNKHAQVVDEQIEVRQLVACA
jgi:hypothetical protein